jgi:hypothetical protein
MVILERLLKLREIASLNADSDRGLTDLVEGWFRIFDSTRIIERGRKLFTGR